MDASVVSGRIAAAARVVRARVRAVFRKQALDDELARELAFHVEALTAEFEAEGLSPEDARVAARRAMGNLALLAEECQDERRVTWLHDLRQDFAYGARMLAKNPGFTAVVVLSLALGIGANTAILDVMYAVFRDPLPIAAAERVVVVRAYPRSGLGQESNATLDEFFAWQEQNQSFATIGVGLGNNADTDADGDMPAQRLQGQSTTPDTFEALQVRPLLGRVLTHDDAYSATPSQSPPRAVVISYRLWQGRFGGAPDVTARTLRLNGVAVPIVGVMPPGFHYPSQVVDYWIAMRAVPGRGQTPPSPGPTPERFFVVTARLKPGVSLEQAQADLERIAATSARDSERADVWMPRVRPVRDVMYGWTMRPLVALGAAVALVLLVACTNVAGLLLARTLVRENEIAVRVALGAPRGRLVRQLLTESVLMASIGGLLGVIIAWMGVRALSTMQPPPGAVAIGSVGLHPAVLAIMAAISIATGLVFGLAPALMASGSRLGQALKNASRDAGGTRPRLREAVVAAQIALTFVLLVGAGLATRSFLSMMSRDLHFDTARLLTFEINFPPPDYMRPRGIVDGQRYFEIDPSPAPTFERVYDRVRQIPGAQSVAGTSTPLLTGLVIPEMRMIPDGIDDRAASASYFLVTPGFFTSLRAALIAGRDFTDTDRESSPWVAIVNESAARRFWPGENPIGRTVRLTSVREERPRQVVGVIRDIPLRLIELGDRAVVYSPYLQQPSHYPLPGANMMGRMAFMVRATGDPRALIPAVREAVRAVVPDRPLANVGTLDAQMRFIIPQQDDFALVLSVFALTAALLAGIGIYGVTSYSVAQRTREIGVRMALGAGARSVMARVGYHALIIVVIGLAVGMATVIALLPALRSFVWGISPIDPMALLGAVASLLVVCGVGSLLPARRAAAVDPTVALRSE